MTGVQTCALPILVLSAAYMLTMFQKIFLGESRDTANDTLQDLDWREVVTVAPLLIMCFVIGLYATPFFNAMSGSLAQLLPTAVTTMR